jgi:DNA-binding transcriptional LysR family regulator
VASKSMIGEFADKFEVSDWLDEFPQSRGRAHPSLKLDDGVLDRESLFDLNLLLALVYLLETKSVTEASVLLGVTQPSMSRSLAKLRTVFNDKLLLRSGRGCVLTQRALSLKSGATRILELARGLRHTAVSPERIESFTLAAGAVETDAVISWAVTVMQVSSPGALAGVRSISGPIFEQLRDGDVDFAVVAEEQVPDELRFVPLKQCNYLIALDRQHPLIAGMHTNQLALSQTAAFPHVIVCTSEMGRRQSRSNLAAMGFRRVVVSGEAPHTRIGLELLKNSEAILVAPEFSFLAENIPHHAVVVPAFDLLRQYRPRLIWHERLHADEASSLFRASFSAALSAGIASAGNQHDQA